MNSFSRIRDLWPRNTLTYAQCKRLCELIYRNRDNNGLAGPEREEFDRLIALAESNEKQAPIFATDYFS